MTILKYIPLLEMVIEIIDIECVLLSFLSKKFVSTKWRIYKGILVGPRLLRQGLSRGCRESTAKFAKHSLLRRHLLIVENLYNLVIQPNQKNMIQLFE
jgi:hypothetical protein